MHTEADFVRAIVECPKDDQVRLVFADWLEENDQSERASFIRQQQAVPDWESPEDVEVVNPKNGQKAIVKCRYRRGMIFRIELRSDAFEWCAPILFRMHPIEEVTLKGKSAAYHLSGWRHTICQWMLQWYEGWDYNTYDYTLSRPITNVLIDIGEFSDIEFQSGRGVFYKKTKTPTESPHTINLFYSVDPIQSGALSRGCVEWGRRQANIPSLQVETLLGCEVHSLRS